MLNIYLPATPKRRAACCLALIWTLLIRTEIVNAETKSKSANFDASVGAGIWDGIKLSNMNAGAQLEISGSSSSSIAIYLFSKLEDESFLPVDDAVVSTVSDTDFDFVYQVPADGDYVLVLDNRDSTQTVDYKISMTASIEAD
jgi:hypothetical protein